MNLKTIAAIEGLLPALSKDKEERLTEELKVNGCRDKIVVWKGRSVIVDGHHRYKICRKLKIPYQIEEMPFEGLIEAMAYVISLQESRREQTPIQRKISLGKMVRAMEEDDLNAANKNGTKPRSMSDLVQGASGLSGRKKTYIYESIAIVKALDKADSSVQKMIYDENNPISDSDLKKLLGIKKDGSGDSSSSESSSVSSSGGSSGSSSGVSPGGSSSGSGPSTGGSGKGGSGKGGSGKSGAGKSGSGNGVAVSGGTSDDEEIESSPTVKTKGGRLATLKGLVEQSVKLVDQIANERGEKKGSPVWVELHKSFKVIYKNIAKWSK